MITVIILSIPILVMLVYAQRIYYNKYIVFIQIEL